MSGDERCRFEESYAWKLFRFSQELHSEFGLLAVSCAWEMKLSSLSEYGGSCLCLGMKGGN